MGPTTTAVPESTVTLKGLVHGGNNPVTGATIGLYRAGTSGYASAATQILMQSVTTDGSGFFGLTGKYHCNAASDQMYITATQGNPGLGTGGNNPALVMVAALGNCGNLSDSTYIVINEITTVAAAWSLGQFSADYAHIGTSSTNSSGLQNAFLNSQLIASTATGNLPVLLSTQVTEPGKILALADAMAPCINSPGDGPCTSFFAAATPSGGTAPTDTFTAALNIVKHPGQNVQAVFNNIASQSPFPTTQTSAPHDWTLSLTVSGGGLSSSEGLAVDQLGNVWIAGYNGVLSAYSPQGVPISGAGFGLGGTLYENYGVAIDANGNVWVTNEETPAHSPTRGGIVQFQGAFKPSSTALGALLGGHSDASLDFPESIFVDSNGYVDVANFANGTASVYNGSGPLVASGLASTVGAFPVSIMADSSHGVWMANQQSDTIAHDVITGGQPTSVQCCGGANGVALDHAGNIWVTDYWTDSFSEVSPSSVILMNQVSVGGVNSPAGLFVDGNQNVWIANYHGSSISSIAGAFNTLPAGTGLSPDTVSSTQPGGYGLDAKLLEPFALVGDNSGNVWVSNHGHDNLVMFFGLAAPTTAPLSSSPALP